jgi:hypothetical protein
MCTGVGGVPTTHALSSSGEADPTGNSLPLPHAAFSPPFQGR